MRKKDESRIELTEIKFLRTMTESTKQERRQNQEIRWTQYTR